MGRTAMIVCRIYMVFVGLYPLIHFPNFKRMQAGLFTSAMTKAQIDGRRLDDIPNPLHSVALHNYYSDVFAKGFGIEITAGPITSEMKVLPQRRCNAPYVAPLTGPLVFAETLGVKNKSFNKHSDSTSKLSSHRDQSSSSPNDKSLSFKKKNKYVLTNPYISQKQQQQPVTLPFVLTDQPASSLDSDYILQKREPAKDVKPSTELPQMPPLTVSDSSVDVKPAAVVDAAVRKKKKKLKKRSLDDVNNKEEAKLKKKRREGFGQDFPPLFKKQAVKPYAETESEAEYASESSVAPLPLSGRVLAPRC